jgi:hypothetical protein
MVASISAPCTSVVTIRMEARPSGGTAIKVAYDPSTTWGARERYDATVAVRLEPPEARAKRIAEMVATLKSGRRDR